MDANPQPCDGVHDFENAVLVSRATWVCPDCKEDISFLYVLWWDAVHYGEELKKKP